MTTDPRHDPAYESDPKVRRMVDTLLPTEAQKNKQRRQVDPNEWSDESRRRAGLALATIDALLRQGRVEEATREAAEARGEWDRDAYELLAIREAYSAWAPVDEQLAWWVVRVDKGSPVVGGQVVGPFNRHGAFAMAAQALASGATTAVPFYHPARQGVDL